MNITKYHPARTNDDFSFSGRKHHIIGVQTGALLTAGTVLRFRLQRSGGSDPMLLLDASNARIRLFAAFQQ